MSLTVSGSNQLPLLSSHRFFPGDYVFDLSAWEAGVAVQPFTSQHATPILHFHNRHIKRRKSMYLICLQMIYQASCL